MKGQLIGQGNTAEVYTWEEDEILKLFRSAFPWEGVKREYNVSKAVEKLGLPVPKVGQLIELEGRRGITYERITGNPMLEQLMRHPFSIGKYSKHLAEMHYQVHQCTVKELPKYKEALEWNIRHTEFLTEGQRLEVLNLLDKLPEEYSLCHGDFHPGNIILNSEKSIILDWMTAASGCPAADVARTMMLLRDAVLPDNIPKPMKLVVNLVRRRVAKVYLKRYQQLSDITKSDIFRWRLPLIAARLTEWVPDKEMKAILKEINKFIVLA